MSSPEADSHEDVPPILSEQVKRKKKPRACDFCRRKKIRCDGAEMPDHRCTRCISQGIECTYEPINTRPPSKSYVQILENRLQNMEKLFNQLHPNVPIPKEFDNALDSSQWPAVTETLPSGSRHHSSSPSAAVSPPAPDSPIMDSDELESSEDERDVRTKLMKSFKRVDATPNHNRYHGKSSNMMFLQSVLEAKKEYSGREPVRSAESSKDAVRRASVMPDNIPPTITGPPFATYGAEGLDRTLPPQIFPPPDIMDMLIELYFKHINLYLPVLHRQTFGRQIREGLHTTDHGFGSIVLLVCANAARWLKDVVLPDGGRAHEPGWFYFKQVEATRWSFLERPRLEDLQACALIASYLTGSGFPQGSWTMIGLGLRLAQDVGAHRKKMYSSTPCVKDELWKRAFWALVTIDRYTSFSLGRPSAMRDEEFDVEPLVEVDDEYWINEEHPELAFKQPAGKPSLVTFANCFARLFKVLSFASRTIYSINKSKLSMGYVGVDWEQGMVAELDSALNKWIDTVPEHLQWDPNRENLNFLDQSATLHAHYYLCQICVHRRFIASPRKMSRMTFPSLTICTNAARSCIHVLDTQSRRGGSSPIFNRLPLFTSGLVLLLNMWGGKRSGLSDQSTMADIKKCMNMFDQLAEFTFSARRLREVLNMLMDKEFPPMGPPSSTQAWKAGVGAIVSGVLKDHQLRSQIDIFDRQPASANMNGNEMLSPFYPTATQPPASSSAGTPLDPSGEFSMDAYRTLPLHTEELGRLPFHHGFRVPRGLSRGFSAPLDQMHPQTRAFLQNILLQGSQPPQGSTPPPFPSNDPPMRVTDYSELLSALSVPMDATADANMNANAPMGPPDQLTLAAQATAQAAPQASVGVGADVDLDVDMDVLMSAENLEFAGNMMEMWSTAPTSLEWDDWGAYLSTMTGTNNPFDVPPSGM